jgi:hypothetical protein
MKSGFNKWMVLAVAVLVSTSAWAIWNPDTDGALLFNMNFENGSNVTHQATDVKALLVGTLYDYNTIEPNVFGEASVPGLGIDGNFAAIHDMNTGKGYPEGNDVKLVFTGFTTLWNLGMSADKHTWAFWFNVPGLSDGTILRHANIASDPNKVPLETYLLHQNEVWEIRIYGGKLQFYHKNNTLKMETASSLSDLGLTTNTWHHAAIIIDRTNSVETVTPTTALSTKIYIDGLEVPVMVMALDIGSMDINPNGDSPFWIGAGEREFDGLLDDVRLYSRVLTPLEVSILNQPDATKPRALSPIPRSSNVVISTDLSWEPAAGATAQTLYFGTDQNNLPSKPSGVNQATNAQIGGPLAFSKKYYWYIRSTIGGVDSNGPLWWFNSETGKAINPSPRDGQQDVDVCDVNLSWFTPTPATNYEVYASADPCLVAASNVSVRIYSGADPCFMGYDPCVQGGTIYWRVNSTYPASGTIPGDIWSFRTNAYELVFNTSGLQTTYADHVIPAYTCLLHSNGWSDACAMATLASDGVAIFNFPNGFNYDSKYDIVVVPQYRATDISYDANFPTPLGIHVTGNFYFDGRVQIAGDDILTPTQANTFAHSGGFPGPKNNQEASVFSDRGVTLTDYWDVCNMPANDNGRFGLQSSAHALYIPTALAKTIWGPGVPVNPPYKGGGGGGSGGVGGDAGRGYFFGVFSGGPSYGDEEVPVPFGGSAGGWGGGSSPGGAAGGGGIEIYASGNVTLDSNSQIIAHGGGQLCGSSAYPAGGGGGGCVRIIAGGSVTNKGIIDVNGGKGGDGTAGNNTGGGGGGGRVAIFHVTGYFDAGTGKIVANGGARGTWGLYGLAQKGQNGTIFKTSGSTKKASAPTPANGNTMVYVNPDPCTIKLKWYSGYGGTTDQVFCDNNANPTTSWGSVAATRGQHDVNMTGVHAGKTYYMKVITDGVSSDIWSFKTVSWECPFAIDNAAPRIGGPVWDNNHDCVLDFDDFWFFAKDWKNIEFGPGDGSTGDYMLDNGHGVVGGDGFVGDLERWASDWLMCYNRTNGGCAGY